MRGDNLLALLPINGTFDVTVKRTVDESCCESMSIRFSNTPGALFASVSHLKWQLYRIFSLFLLLRTHTHCNRCVQRNEYTFLMWIYSSLSLSLCLILFRRIALNIMCVECIRMYIFYSFEARVVKIMKTIRNFSYWVV